MNDLGSFFGDSLQSSSYPDISEGTLVERDGSKLGEVQERILLEQFEVYPQDWKIYLCWKYS